MQKRKTRKSRKTHTVSVLTKGICKGRRSFRDHIVCTCNLW